MQTKPESISEATPVTEEIVRLAYQLLLGRNVESNSALTAHLSDGTVADLRRIMMSSEEFQNQIRQQGALIFNTSKWVSVDVLDRFTMWVDLSDAHVSRGCLMNNWEANETHYVTSTLCAGDVVLDIGANIGWFSLVAAKSIGLNGRVHAFEPRPETASMLKRTISDNRLRQQVTVWEFALADRSEIRQLFWGTGGNNPGGSSLLRTAEPHLAGHESAAVKAVVLDEILPDVAPDFIKIDVEGAEPQALSGAKNAIMRKKPKIISELHPRQLQAVSGVTVSQYIDLLSGFGYSCYLLENGRPTDKLRNFPAAEGRDLVSVVFEFGG